MMTKWFFFFGGGEQKENTKKTDRQRKENKRRETRTIDCQMRMTKETAVARKNSSRPKQDK